MTCSKIILLCRENIASVICIVISTALFVILFAYNSAEKSEGIQYLYRGSYGQGDTVYNLLVEGVDGKQNEMEILVHERQYTDEEAAAVFEEIVEKIGAEICGKNNNLSSVTDDLKLVTWLEEYGVRLRWYSDEPELLNSMGNVNNENLTEKKQVVLSLTLTDGIHSAEYAIPVQILPAKNKGELADKLRQSIIEAEEYGREKEKVELPKEYNGTKLKYKSSGNHDYWMLPLLGILTGFLLYEKKKQDIKKKCEKRNKKLMLDYAEVVSKLRIFMGAGMTMRNSWERIVNDYRQSVKSLEKEKRPAYEEMQRALYQMQSGVPEGSAYREFGRRCALRPYIKLSSLLEQNMRTGTKNLNNILHMEMVDAFEQRKNLAKRSGEEAGTRLLMPLFMMLGIVMVIITVPAMAAF